MNPFDVALRAENARLRRQVAALTERVLALQIANEGADRDLQAATGGAHFCPAQPFGQPTTEATGAAA
jgi:hypothetical protein